MGARYHSKRLQTRVCPKNPRIQGRLGNTMPPKQSSGKCYKGRNKILVKQGSNRNCPPSFSSKRFLQSPFRGTKTIRRRSSSSKPTTPKQVNKKGAFQNGDITHSHPKPPKRGLGNISGSHRCILPHSNLPRTQEVPTLCFRGQGISVQSPPFRPVFSTKGLHQSDKDSPCLLKEKFIFSPGVLRRLATKTGHEGNINYPKPRNDSTRNQIGMGPKFGEIKPNSETNIHFPRSSLQPEVRHSLPFTGQNRRHPRVCKENKSQNSNHESFTTPSFGPDGFMYRPNTMGKTSHEANTAIPACPLETVVSKSASPHSSDMSPNQSLAVVGGSIKSPTGDELNATQRQLCTNNRCLELGLGRTSGRLPDFRPVVQIPTEETHKLARNASRIPITTALCNSSEKSSSTSQNGQHDSCQLHKQTGGDTITQSLHSVMEHAPVVSKKGNHTESSSHTGSKKHPGGCPIKGKNSPNRVDAEPIHCSQNFSEVGPTTHRPLCIEVKQSTSDICICGTRPGSMGNRCPVDFMGRNVSVRISPTSTNPQSSRENQSTGLCGNSDSSLLAKASMVSRTDRITSGNPPLSPNRGSNVIPAPQQDLPPRSTDIQVNCMEIVKNQFIEKGFSVPIANRASQARRQSTYRTYDGRIRVFFSWARERGVPPLSASVTQIADFLEYLFVNKNLTARTIAGYRAAISAIHPGWQGVKVGMNKELEKLLKAYFQARPPTRRLAPSWNLPLVLRMLGKSPFEPMSTASLKLKTFKTAFLIAVASGRRCSSLHALSVNRDHMRWDPGGVTLTPAAGFLAKNDSMSYLSKAIRIPKLSNFSEDADERLVCPCRALRYYLKATENLRGNTKQLFITFKTNNHKPATRDTLARWIVQTVKMTYESSDENDAIMVKAHDTRSLSSSWALFQGTPLNEIMEAASWAVNTTFTSFYLRDILEEKNSFGRAVLRSSNERC